MFGKIRLKYKRRRVFMFVNIKSLKVKQHTIQTTQLTVDIGIDHKRRAPFRQRLAIVARRYNELVSLMQLQGSRSIGMFQDSFGR